MKISDDDYKEKKCKRQKKSNGSKFTNDDNNMQMSESKSEVRVKWYLLMNLEWLLINSIFTIYKYYLIQFYFKN